MVGIPSAEHKRAEQNQRHKNRHHEDPRHGIRPVALGAWLYSPVAADSFRAHFDQRAGAGLGPDGDPEYRVSSEGIVLGEDVDFMILKQPPRTDSLLVFYPNPSRGEITIEVRNENPDHCTAILRVADFSGRIHHMEELDLSAGMVDNRFRIQLPGDLKSGYYSVMLEKGEEKRAGKLILLR